MRTNMINRFNEKQALQVIITVMITMTNDVENDDAGAEHRKLLMCETYCEALAAANKFTEELWLDYREFYVASVQTTITID